jgi:hypothetical protein
LMPEAHFLSFSLLAVLSLVARWPWPRWATVVVLVVYAGASEMAQRYVPPRTPDILDWLQDLAGIAAGALVCWAAASLTAALLMARAGAYRAPVPSPVDPGDVMRNVETRCNGGGRSWWR